MLLRDLEEERSQERRRLQMGLRELEWAAWLAGNPALLYCSACEAAVSSEIAIEGSLEGWPYCPIHEEKPLMIHSTFPGLARR